MCVCVCVCMCVCVCGEVKQVGFSKVEEGGLFVYMCVCAYLLVFS
jgi:hypothetical protein